MIDSSDVQLITKIGIHKTKRREVYTKTPVICEIFRMDHIDYQRFIP